jgi:hypothetical protein
VNIVHHFFFSVVLVHITEESSGFRSLEAHQTRHKLGKGFVGPPREIDPKAGADNSSQCYMKSDVNDMGEVDLSRYGDVFLVEACIAW